MWFINVIVKVMLGLFVLILAGGGVWYIFAPHPPATPKEVKDMAQMEVYLENLVASGNPPGLSMAVVKNGQIVYNRAFGMADAPKNKAATVNTVYHWWSMTKIPTAIAILQLYERGQLQLDDPVEEYLPWFWVQYPVQPSQANGQKLMPKITLRQLLNHSSGLPDTTPAMIGWVHYEDETRSQTELLKRHLPSFNTLQFEPGSKAIYSNLNYMVLGAVIEAVSGRSYEEYITEEILKPLRMDQSGFVYTKAMAEDEAAGTLPIAHFYTLLLPFLLNTSALIREQLDGIFWMRRLYIDVTPPTGLIGPASDMARLMLAYLNGGELEGVRILSPQSIELMTHGDHVLGEGPNMSAYTDGQHGLGWYIIPEDEQVRLQHHGGGPGFATTMRLYPEQGLGIVILANGTDLDRDGLADRLAELMVDYPYRQTQPPIRSASALDWSEVVKVLTNPSGTSWLSTVSGEDQVHTVPIGAFFVNETFYFTSGQGTCKRANLDQNPSCTICIHAGDYDIVAEGTAAITRDEAKVQQLAAFCQSISWPVEAKGGTLDAPYHAPTTGPAPYDVYEMTLRKVFVLGITDEGINHCTRFTFQSDYPHLARCRLSVQAALFMSRKAGVQGAQPTPGY